MCPFVVSFVRHTNVPLLHNATPPRQTHFLLCLQAANLYAMSVFGEDALVNVSVEKKSDADGKLSGHVRIRSKTQGIALSLGDRITLVQRGQGATNAQP